MAKNHFHFEKQNLLMFEPFLLLGLHVGIRFIC
jgi:hypothetical protein